MQLRPIHFEPVCAGPVPCTYRLKMVGQSHAILSLSYPDLPGTSYGSVSVSLLMQ